MEDKYYTPSLDEFVQGFEFERLGNKKGDRLGALVFFDFSKDADVPMREERPFFCEEDDWHKITVFWDREPRTRTTESEGVSFTWKEFPKWDWYPWTEEGYIEKLIKDGKVRARK